MGLHCKSIPHYNDEDQYAVGFYSIDSAAIQLDALFSVKFTTGNRCNQSMPPFQNDDGVTSISTRRSGRKKPCRVAARDEKDDQVLCIIPVQLKCLCDWFVGMCRNAAQYWRPLWSVPVARFKIAARIERNTGGIAGFIVVDQQYLTSLMALFGNPASGLPADPRYSWCILGSRASLESLLNCIGLHFLRGIVDAAIPISAPAINQLEGHSFPLLAPLLLLSLWHPSWGCVPVAIYAWQLWLLTISHSRCRGAISSPGCLSDRPLCSTASIFPAIAVRALMLPVWCDMDCVQCGF